MNDKKLWKAFSEYIRRRDSDENGYGKCFTCGRINHFRKMDCGHGIGRQHWATKYDERNNHIQCKYCNGLEGGMRERYKEEMNKRYGPNAWDLMEIKSRQKVIRPTQDEVDIMTEHYKKLAKKMSR